LQKNDNLFSSIVANHLYNALKKLVDLAPLIIKNRNAGEPLFRKGE